ncbi:MAG: hypothetical protein AAGI48_05850 [Verrucomicrobiota bacterium]
MRLEAKQKLSSAALILVVAFSALAFAVALVLWILGGDASLASGEVVVSLALATGLLAFMAACLHHSGCRLHSDGVELGRAFGSMVIPYETVSRVERIARRNGGKSEKVRITFSDGSKVRKVDVMPESPAQLVSDLVSRCPGLTSSRKRKIKKDSTFRVAKQPLAVCGELDMRRMIDPEKSWGK